MHGAVFMVEASCQDGSRSSRSGQRLASTRLWPLVTKTSARAEIEAESVAVGVGGVALTRTKRVTPMLVSVR